MSLAAGKCLFWMHNIFPIVFDQCLFIVSKKMLELSHFAPNSALPIALQHLLVVAVLATA